MRTLRDVSTRAPYGITVISVCDFALTPGRAKRYGPIRGAELALRRHKRTSRTNITWTREADLGEQFRAIGWFGTRLYTVIFEIREDEEGEYYHLVTLWKSTR